MAEPDIGTGLPAGGLPGPNWRLIIIATISIIVIFLVVMVGFRACGGGGGGGAFTTIYSNLELKDAAEVTNRLKELRIPYEIKDQGTTIAVGKDRADEARLGLAIKGLPQGGVVGFEIFDETRFGATDFDKRIQLIRALSGELSRTISRIDGVESARVQIVVPKTELFATEKSPVTASVMLKLIPKKQLSPEQVKGIIHLVSSSVEGLLPENVTVVDSFGHILTGGEYMVEISKLEEGKKEAAEIKPEIKEEKKTAAAPKGVTAEEILNLELKAKAELEEQLQRRSQIVLNKFYPPNTAVVKVNVELGPTSKVKQDISTLESEEPLYAVTLGGIQRLSAIILVDESFKDRLLVKKATFQAVAAAIGYDRRRGDQIIVNAVPFYAASASYEEGGKTAAVKEAKKKAWFYETSWRLSVLILCVTLLLVAGVALIYRFRNKQSEIEVTEKESSILSRTRSEAPPSAQELEQARRIADQDPGRLAELVKSWIEEETTKEGI